MDNEEEQRGNQVYIVAWTCYLDQDGTLEEHKAFSQSIVDLSKLQAKRWVFQMERCPNTNRLHWQGYWNLRVKRRLDTLGLAINSDRLKFHLSPASGPGREALRLYCMKQETRVDGPYTDRPLYTGRDIAIVDTNRRPYQTTILEEIKGPINDRTINWVWDSLGNTGKSKFCKYLRFRNGACVFRSIKSADLQYVVAEDGPNLLYVFDMERTRPQDIAKGDLYSNLEIVKDGLIKCGKFKGGDLCMDPPHIYVFANFHPDVKRLSMDRWCIREINREYKFN